MRFEVGQVMSAEWDGDGSWRVVTVLGVEGERVEVRVHSERFPGPPAAGALHRLDTGAGEVHALERDEFLHMRPIVIAADPSRPREPAAATRRDLFQGLLRRGFDR
jgi:hypothetical protein